MNKTYESFIKSFIEDKVGITDHFLGLPLSADLRDNLLKLYSGKEFHAAGTGNGKIDYNKQFRSDQIHWLNRKNGNESENSFFEVMDDFVAYMNSTCYTGINDYEFHYTMYPAGSFYKRHMDQFRDDDSRKFSMIMYLNEDWKKADGGELCIYHDAGEQKISPDNGKSVFFKSSELEHEVLITTKDRMSITGWLKA